MATKIRGLQIVDSIAGAAIDLTSSGILNVLVDDSSIEVSGGNALQVKSGGVTNAMLANDSVTVTAGDALSGGGEVDLGGTIELDVVVDGTTISNAGDQLSVIASGIDHGSLADLGADDHTQYILADGTRAFTGIFQAVGMELTEGDVKLYSAPAAGDVSGITASGTTAATFGQVVYVDGSGNYVAAKADASATMPAAALVTAVSNEVMTAGYVTVSGWGWTPGGLLYVSDATAGDMTQTAPTASGSQVQIVGVAISATTIYFNPDATTVELGDSPFYTKEEVDALITTSSGDILSYISDNYIDNSEMTTISGDILSYVSNNYIDNSEMTTISGDILQYVSDNYIDNSEMTTISGDILQYVSDNYIDNSEMTTISGDILQYVSDNYVDNSEMTTISGDIMQHVEDDFISNGEMTTISGDIVDQIIWELVDTPTNRIQPKAAYMTYPVYIAESVTIGGNLTVTGTTFYTETEEVLVSDNFIYINYGEPGSGVTSVTAGIDVDRGGFPSYVFAFDERNDTFRIGVSGSQDAFNDYPLQPVATREDTPTDTRVAWWDAASYTFRTQGDSYVTINSGTDTITLGVNNATEVTIGTGGLALKTGGDVNEIVTTITSSSTDDQLATANAIYDLVNSVSGSIVHNELEGLQGGNGSDEYYHLDLTAFTALSGVDGTQVGQWDTAYSHTLLTNNPHSVTYSQVGAIQDSNDTVKDTHIDWGSGANQVDLDDVPDGTSYERVAASQLTSGIYIDATTSTKGIASFSSDNFAVTSGVVTVKDDGIAEAELVIVNAPVDGYYLQYTTASGMKWTDVSTEGVLESDFQLDNMSASCNGVTTQFYLSYIPVANSLQVYLNGLLQEKGGGLDYTNTTSGVLFTTAPLTGDILIAHYVRTSA